MHLVTAIITEQGVMHPPIAIDSILSFKNTK
jgi:methylthioribose-1-phosphate isomerase